jgi:uncharacterized membrane protein
MIATVLYSNGGMTIRGVAKILKSCPSTILGWVRLAGLRVRNKIFEKIDEMWHFLKKMPKIMDH